MKNYDSQKRRERYLKNKDKEIEGVKKYYQKNQERLKKEALDRYYAKYEENKRKNRERMRKKRAAEKAKRSTVKIDVSKKHTYSKVEEK